ncbi:unnamed protein product [Caretta caretta]
MDDNHHQYKVLPFGLSTAPLVFSKVLAVVAAYLRKQGDIIFPYSKTVSSGPQLRPTFSEPSTTMDLFTKLGLLMNLEKSTLMPVQYLEYGITMISSCIEFSDVKLRTNEKKILNTLNKDKNRITIRFPMEGKIKTREMKVNWVV